MKTADNLFACILLSAFLIISPAALAYLPPVYIASQETGECRYYFAGDALHFNEPPNGTWHIVGVSEAGIEECSDRCFFNSDKFWQEVLTVTKATLSISDVPKDYRIFGSLNCLCSGNGSQGCENWCKISGGSLNSTNWTNSVSCNCPDGSWIPGKGCQESGESSVANQSSQKDTVASIITFLIVFVSGLIIGLFAGAIKTSKAAESAHGEKQAHLESKDSRQRKKPARKKAR